MATLEQEYASMNSFTPLSDLNRIRDGWKVILSSINNTNFKTAGSYKVNMVVSSNKRDVFLKRYNLQPSYFIGFFSSRVRVITWRVTPYPKGQIEIVAMLTSGGTRSMAFVSPTSVLDKVTEINRKLANTQRMIANITAEIKRVKEMEARAAAARKRELKLQVDRNEALMREAKTAELMRKSQEEQAKLIADAAAARAREVQRNVEIQAARDREAKLLADIAAARVREAAKAKLLVNAVQFQLSVDKDKLRRQVAIAGKAKVIAEQTSILANKEERIGFIEDLKASKAENIAMIQDAAKSGRALEDQLQTSKEIIFDIDQMVRKLAYKKISSKRDILDVIDEIKAADKQVVGTFGEDIFEKNRKGWIESLRITALNLPDPEVKKEVVQEIQIVEPKKMGLGIPVIIVGLAAAYTTFK